MRILHLFGNWKWTGPAEPAINLAWQQRAHHQVEVAVGRCPFADLDNVVAAEARKRELEVVEVPALQKHLNPIKVLRAARWLARHVEAQQVDVVHVHLDADHVAAAIARRRVPHATLVRTFHETSISLQSPRLRWLLKRTDGALVISHRQLEQLQSRWPGWANRLAVFPGAIDLTRFQPRARTRAELRRALRWPEQAVLAGIVARVQKHRRYEVLLEALKLARERVPALELVVLGRGTFADQIAGGTARRLGIEAFVHRPGYLAGDGYVDALSALDFAVFLVPGTDGSCRAVREELAMGLPVIAAPVDPLPEIVAHGERGLIAAVEPQSLAAALVELAGNDGRRQALAAQAREHAQREFSLARQSAAVDAIYAAAARMRRARA